MPNLRRLGNIGKARFSGLMAPAEDPRQTFANAFERQRELLLQVQQALATVGASKDRLNEKNVQVRAKLPQLDEQARRALIAGREDLARLALRRRHVAVVELQALEEQMIDVQREEQKLSLLEHRLATQIEAFHARQEVIAARYSAAEAQVKINEALTGVSQELVELGRALEQAETKTEHMQARATAIDNLVEAGILELPGQVSADAIDRLIGRPDVGDVVEEQMARLRQEIGTSGELPRPRDSPPALPSEART